MNKPLKQVAIATLWGLLYLQGANADPTPVAPTPRLLGAADTMPSWGPDGQILFYTTRPLFIDGKEVPQPMVREDGLDGLIYGLGLYDPNSKKENVSLLIKTPSLGSYASWSMENKIAFSDGTKIGIIDFNLPSIQAVNVNRVFRFDASWSPDGEHLVMSGTHSPTDSKGNETDQDIFVSEIKSVFSTNPVLNTRAIVRLSGDDKLPFYSPSGEWIYFAHREQNSFASTATEFPKKNSSQIPDKNWSIRRVRTNSNSEAPEVVIAQLEEPERLSFFPDGKRIFVSFGPGIKRYSIKPSDMGIVDVEKKVLTPFQLNTANDPLNKYSSLLNPQAVALSPDGKQLAFSALIWSAIEDDLAWFCIYTCDLDGSNLKRITPVDKSGLAPYIYDDLKLKAADAWYSTFNVRK